MTGNLNGLHVAILGPLGTYTHEARSVPSVPRLLNEIPHRQHTTSLALVRYTRNNLRYQVLNILYHSYGALK
jgi:hypothetical protein